MCAGGYLWGATRGLLSGAPVVALSSGAGTGGPARGCGTGVPEVGLVVIEGSSHEAWQHTVPPLCPPCPCRRWQERESSPPTPSASSYSWSAHCPAPPCPCLTLPVAFPVPRIDGSLSLLLCPKVIRGHIQKQGGLRTESQGTITSAVLPLPQQGALSALWTSLLWRLPSAPCCWIVQTQMSMPSLRCVAARVNVWLVGPAGSGKTSAAENVARDLGLKFYSKSVGPQTSESALLCCTNVFCKFRECWL